MKSGWLDSFAFDLAMSGPGWGSTNCSMRNPAAENSWTVRVKGSRKAVTFNP